MGVMLCPGVGVCIVGSSGWLIFRFCCGLNVSSNEMGSMPRTKGFRSGLSRAAFSRL
jgi:hypothetical protein